MSNTKAPNLTERAAEWLRARLAGGPVASYRLVQEAEGQFSPSALRHARLLVGAVIHTGSEPGRPFVAWWSLPDEPEAKESKEQKVAIPSTRYGRDEILAYNQAFLDQQQGKAFYFTPPGGEPQLAWLARLPVTRDNLERAGLDEVDLPGVEVFEALGRGDRR